jgi:hypothetical protein
MHYIHSKVLIVLLSIIFLIIGLGLLYFSKNSFVSSQQFVKNSITASGTVIDIIQQTNTNHTNGSINYTYAPKVSFTANDGKAYTFIPSTSGSSSSYHDGERVEILYNPLNPYDANIDSFWDIWGLPIILLVMGIGFSIIGVLGIIFPKWFARNQPQNQPNIVT